MVSFPSRYEKSIEWGRSGYANGVIVQGDVLLTHSKLGELD